MNVILKSKLESELNRLVNLGIFQPIPISHWAATIVLVMKKQRFNLNLQ